MVISSSSIWPNALNLGLVNFLKSSSTYLLPVDEEVVDYAEDFTGQSDYGLLLPPFRGYPEVEEPQPGVPGPGGRVDDLDHHLADVL